MARTTTMRLIELMVLREDIHSVLKYLGELGEFQFQQEFASDSSDSAKRLNPDASVFERLQRFVLAGHYKHPGSLLSGTWFGTAAHCFQTCEQLFICSLYAWVLWMSRVVLHIFQVFILAGMRLPQPQEASP